MKLIFLDIDGVLNSKNWEDSLPYGKLERKDAFDPAAVARLNKITDVTGAKIVVSSSWRLSFMNSKEMLFEYLREAEGITGELIDITPCLTNCCRWEEIQDWISNSEADIESFVILDDIDSMGDLQDHLILTTYKRGLLDIHVNIAISKLNKI